MSRRALGALLVVATAVASSATLAEPSGPDASRVRQAAESYDAGVRAWSAGRYAAAASHFEAADEAVPSAVSLTEAIKSRRRAGHQARAATLAALARRRHPSHGALSELVDGVLNESRSSLHRLEVLCPTACVLAAGTRAIPGAAARAATIYVEPGVVTISASFAAGGGSARQEVTAQAGGSDVVEFPLPAERPSAPPAGGEPATDPGAASRSTGVRSPAALAATAPPVPPGSGIDEGWPGMSPAVFFVGVGVSTVLTGVTIWSGVDTLGEPGQDAVRADCVGLGTACPAYQDGLAKEDRTNALIGVTVATAAVTTLVGLLLTDWGTDEEERSAPSTGAKGTRWPLEASVDPLRLAF